MEGWGESSAGSGNESGEWRVKLFYPDGRRFASYVEMVQQRDQAERKVQELLAQLKKLGVDPEDKP